MAETYGGFAMPGDDFFYLSSMYSDKLLTEFLPTVKNQAYQRYLQIQKDILNSNEISGSFAENKSFKYYFKESLELNTEFGFPVGSLYADITDQDFYLDIGDKLKFIRKFKNFNTPISSTDIIENPDIFTHAIRGMIGDFYFNKFYIMKDKYQRVYLAIKCSSTDGLTKTAMNRIIALGTEDKPVEFCFWKDLHAAGYKYSGSLTGIIYSSSSTSKKRINIPKSGKMNKLYHTADNNWSLMMTYDSIRYGSQLFTVTNASLVSETSTTLVFEIPTAFVNDISSRNTTVTCAAIQRANRKAIYAYKPSTDKSPWLALGEYDRPSSIANVKIYQYDETTMTYKKRIHISNYNFNKEFNSKVNKKNYDENLYFENVIFPAIYNLENITTPIRIEVIEFDPSITNTSFANHLRPLFENISSDGSYTYDSAKYLEYLSYLNAHKDDAWLKSILTRLTEYNPMNVYMDYDDFLASGKNIREYKFGKLMSLIASDPYIYAEYIKFMDKQNFNIVRESGSPKHFKFNSGLTGDLTGNNPLVNDDSFTCVNKNDEVFFFSEPNSYIKIHSDNPDVYCLVFVGGRLITPTRIKSKLNDIYIFISQSAMKKYIQEGLEKFNGAGLSVDNLITVELYSKINRSTSNQIHYSTIFESSSIEKKLFDGDENFTFKLADLVIYNKITGEYIPLNKFDITAVLQRSTIEFDDGMTDKVIGTIKDIIYMGTNLGEFYMTKDNLRIILEEDTEDQVFPNGDSDTGGRKDNYSGFVNKEWNANDLKFKINDPKLVGTEIEFVYSPVGYQWDIPFERFTKNDDGTYHYKLGGFIGNNDIKMFDLYVNGEYVNPANYLVVPNGVGTDDYIELVIDPSTLNLWYSSTTYIIQLRYNPTTYMKENGTSGEITYLDYTEQDIPNYYSPYLYKMYECNDHNHYFNSDNSRVFVYSDATQKNTALNRPYSWVKNKMKIDLQDRTCMSIIHPTLILQESDETPILIDIQRDKSFITNSLASNARSAIDMITTNSKS